MMLLNLLAVRTYVKLFYNYFIHSGSITTATNKTKNAKDLISTVLYLKEIYEKIKNKNSEII